MDIQALEMRFMRATRHFRRMHMAELLADLSHNEFMTLEVLRRYREAHPEQRDMYVSDMVGQARVSAPAVSRTLKALEGRGFIERHVDREDRRNTLIRLTAEGEAARAHAQAEMHAFMQGVFRKMGEESVEQLIVLLERLTAIMEAEGANLREGGPACSKY